MFTPLKKKGTSFISYSSAKPSLFLEACTSRFGFLICLTEFERDDMKESKLFCYLILMFVDINILVTSQWDISNWGSANAIMNNHNDDPRAPEGGWESKPGLCHTHHSHSKVSPHLCILGTWFGLLVTEQQDLLLLLLVASGLQSDLEQVIWDFYSTLKMTQHLASIQQCMAG